MKKKITIAMLKKKNYTDEEARNFTQMFLDGVCEGLEKMEGKDLEETYESANEEELEWIKGAGSVGLWLAKRLMTKGAYKYMMENFKEAIKEDS